MTKRALVTGASGIRRLRCWRVESFWPVGTTFICLVRPDSDSNTWRLQGARRSAATQVDLADDGATDGTRTCASVRPEWIFHLAAHGAYSSQKDSRIVWSG